MNELHLLILQKSCLVKLELCRLEPCWRTEVAGTDFRKKWENLGSVKPGP